MAAAIWDAEFSIYMGPKWMAKHRLLAKQWTDQSSPPEEITLAAHLEKVERMGLAIFDLVGDRVLAHLGLDDSVWKDRLRQGLAVAGRYHDAGKCNQHFQELVRGQSRTAGQPARHELLSGLMLFPNEPLHSGFIRALGVNGIDDPFACAVLGAIFGHHVKLDRNWERAARALHEGGYGTRILLDLSEKQLFDTLNPSQSSKMIPLIDEEPGELRGYQPIFRKLNSKWSQYLDEHPDWARFAGALKALVCAADVLGSALPEGDQGSEWASVSLSRTVSADTIEAVVTERLGGKRPRPFQQRIAAAESRIVLVQAGCGSGKTAAAYMWAQRHSIGKKLFFCYPTTGTATEGFLGYAAHGPIESQLIHSRADIDLNMFYRSGDEDGQDGLLRIESLRAWTGAVTVCTADTVLSLVRNGRKGWYSSPALLSAAFVFDEIHSYDKRMFEAMLYLMQALPQAHFLLMSASLPAARLQEIERLFPETQQVESPRDLESIPRYLPMCAGASDASEAALTVARRGGKVLWVANTVERAQTVFDGVKSEGVRVIAYHSRYRYRDRVNRHRDAIEAFQQDVGVVVVATQVAEMSLDLDADLLISEVAPVSSMIQRMGRLNRRVTPDRPGKPRRALFIEADNNLPYTKADIATGLSWLNSLIARGRPLSQADLSESFLSMTSDTEEEYEPCEWLNTGWIAEPGHVREPGCTVQAILQADENVCRTDNRQFLLNAIPLYYDERRMRDWPRNKAYLIAPEGSLDYDSERGAAWRAK